jgi:hypothetical protein
MTIFILPFSCASISNRAKSEQRLHVRVKAPRRPARCVVHHLSDRAVLNQYNTSACSPSESHGVLKHLMLTDSLRRGSLNSDDRPCSPARASRCVITAAAVEPESIAWLHGAPDWLRHGRFLWLLLPVRLAGRCSTA